MKIGVLTSSRADYGIYLPLLQKMQKDPFFDLHLIVFGTHLSPLHGHTIDAIVKDGFQIDHKVEHIQTTDTEEAIATSMAIVFQKFIPIWKKENYDIVFCLGDRYEMFSAVSAAAIFRKTFAHIHGGETTLGAIDNEFRHCLTLFSSMHFTSTESYAKRVADIKGSKENVYATGALSLDNLNDIPLLSLDEFRQKFKIDLSRPTILITFHPETVNLSENETNANELLHALKKLNGYQLVITMPNADPMGNSMRRQYEEFAKSAPEIYLIENFGTQGYFTCLKHCKLVIGNSSSGIIEAASFNKFVIDIGDRQKGREVSDNVIHSSAKATSILESCQEALQKGFFEGKNIYHQENVADKIISTLKEWKS